MSRKAGLAKKIAHTLMAMSIVYSSGINIVVNEVYAAEKILLENEEIKHGGEFTKSGTPGNDFSASGGITDGEDLSYTGVIKTSDRSGQLCAYLAAIDLDTISCCITAIRQFSSFCRDYINI